MTKTNSPMPTAKTLVDQAQDLPTLPDIYFRVRAILQSPVSTHQDIADALSADPGIAARLLRMANSAFYGRPGRIDTVARAVGQLGTQQIHDLVLATTTIQAFKDLQSDLLDLKTFWYASLVSGSAAKLIAERCHILDSERLFVAGLLAQIGLLLMVRSLPDQMHSIQQEIEAESAPADRLQRERLGFDYADVSAELFTHWQLPDGLVTPIRHHTQPASAGNDPLEAAIVHIAVQLSSLSAPEQPVDSLIPKIDEAAWQAAELSAELLREIHAQSVELTGNIVPILLRAAG